MKSTIKLCHLSKADASLCATVSKRHGAGSSPSIGFDLLTAQCLCSSAADLSSGPGPGTLSGFSNKMINNNNPPRERQGGGGRERELVTAEDVFSLLLLLLLSTHSLSPSSHLKFSFCISSKRDSLCDMTHKHQPSVTQEDLTGWYVHTLLLHDIWTIYNKSLPTQDKVWDSSCDAKPSHRV